MLSTTYAYAVNETSEKFSLSNIEQQNCDSKNCPVIMGTIDSKIILKDQSNIDLTVHFEDCKIDLKGVGVEYKDEIAVLQATSQTELLIVCPGKETRYKNVALLDYNKFLGLKIRRIGENYSHLGKLQAGILFLH